MARTERASRLALVCALSLGAAAAHAQTPGSAPAQTPQRTYLGDPRPAPLPPAQDAQGNDLPPGFNDAAPEMSEGTNPQEKPGRRKPGSTRQSADTEKDSNPSNRRARPGELIQKSNRLEVGARSGLTYTDNINRAPRGLETGGWIAEVSPYAIGDYRSPNARGDLYFALRNFFRTETGNSFNDVDMRAKGDLALVGDWLWIAGNATVFSFSPEPFDLLSVDPAVYSGNVAQYRQFSLSPYIRGRLGSFANYRAYYTHIVSDTSNDTAIARKDQRIGGSLVSGPSASRWSWETSAQSQRRRFTSGTELDRHSARATLYHIFGPQFRLGVIASYEQIDGLTNSDGKDRGAGAGLSVDWVPSTRTQISASVLRQYYGTDASASITHRFNRLSVGLSYARNVLSSSDASVLVFDPTALYSAGGFAPELNPVYETLLNQELLQSFGIPAAAGIVSDGLIRNRTLNASIGYASARNSMVLNLFRSTRESLIDMNTDIGKPVALVGLIEQTGAGVVVAHRLSGNTIWRLSVQRSYVDSPTLGSTSTLDSIQTGVRTRFASNTAAGLGLRRTWQSGQGLNATSYDETAVFGTLDARF